MRYIKAALLEHKAFTSCLHTFELRVDIDWWRNSRAVPPAGFKLPTALFLEDLFNFVHYRHHARDLHTQL